MRPYDRAPSSRYPSASGKPSPAARAAHDGPSRIQALVLALVSKAGQVIQAYRADRTARIAILAILAANSCLIGLHAFLGFIVYFEFLSYASLDQNLLITTDRGYPEMLGYLQLAVVVWVMFHVFIRTRQPIYACLGAIFLLALADDALELHERIGGYAETINLPAPAMLGAQHFGELLAFVAMGALSISILIHGLLASDAEDRRVSGIFILLIFVLGFFAVVIDAIHVVLGETFFGANFLFAIAEDGGEMLTIALALSTALLLFRHLDDLRRPSQ